MATVLRTPPLRAPLPPRLITAVSANCISLNTSDQFCLSLRNRAKLSPAVSLRFATRFSSRFRKFVPFASQGETDTEQQTEEPEIKDSVDDAIEVEDGVEETDESSSSDPVDTEETTTSIIAASLRSYREALASNDESRISEIESFLKSVEDEKTELEKKVASLTEELSVERDRVIRISADFDNFRKRTERERLSLVTNAQGEVVENLLPVLDNFERAKSQLKIDTEGEEKVNNSYQSIYKQFVEILSSIGVVPVETIGKPFDPMLHEAIMREDSAEFEEGIILEEYRKGFKLGDRLLRPSMVKVSAGPGPTKPEQAESSGEAEAEGESPSETSNEAGDTQSESA